MPTMSNYYRRQASFEEQQLYDHWLACRKLATPDQLLERFLHLFIDGEHYPDPDIVTALNTVIFSRWAEQEFKYVLNRCCRILVNYWWFQSHLRWAIVELVRLFDVPPQRPPLTPFERRLRQFVRQFTKTEEYLALKRLAQVVEETVEAGSVPHQLFAQTQTTTRKSLDRNEADRKPLGSLIHRYPYLYPYCLGDDSSDVGQQAVQQLQAERQERYERDLSRYVTYLIQQSQDLIRPGFTHSYQNPTLLTDEQLKKAVRYFAGKVDGDNTIRDSARQLLIYNSQPGQSYQGFKEQLYSYLTTAIDHENPKYGKHHFNNWLHTQLSTTLPDNDRQPLNGFLIGKTCHHLLDCLVSSPQYSSNHLIFIDLINNIGATATIGLVMKILLLYNNLKSNLERRFSLLFRHYEHVRDGVEWLINSLENFQIALSIHYGSVNFPCLNQL